MSSDFPLSEPNETPVDPEAIRPARDERVRPQRRGLSEGWPGDDPYNLEEEGLAPSPPTELVRSPHPGFWWAVLWCLLMLLITQVIVPVGILFAMFFVQLSRLGDLDEAMNWLGSVTESADAMLPLLVGAHISIILLSLLVMRLVFGPHWKREVALRLPSLMHVFLTCVGLPAFWITAMGAYLLASRFLPNMGDLLNYVTSMALTMIVFGAAVGVVNQATGRDWIQTLARAPITIQLPWGFLLCVWIVGLGMGMYYLLATPALFVPFLEEAKFMEEFVKSVREWPWWLGVLVIGGCPGLSEELWCRAFLGRGLVGRHGVVMGVVYASIFFGVIHVHPHQGSMAILAGIGLHYIYLTSRSLLIPMLLHFLNNSLAVVADKLPGPIGKKLAMVDTEPENIPWYLFAAGGCLLVSVIWAFYASRARLEGPDDGRRAWQPPYPGVVLPPEGSATVVVNQNPGLLPVLAVAVSAGTFIATLLLMENH